MNEYNVSSKLQSTMLKSLLCLTVAKHWPQIGDLFCWTCWFVWDTPMALHLLHFLTKKLIRNYILEIRYSWHVTSAGTLLLICNFITIIKYYSYCLLSAKKKIHFLASFNWLSIWNTFIQNSDMFTFFFLSSFTFQFIVLAYTWGKDCQLNTVWYFIYL